jgi:hypothetical protein
MARAKADAGGGPSKMKMVEQAMQELGNASPKDLQAYVQQKFNTEIPTTMISSYKSNITKRTGGRIGGKAGAAAGSVGVRDVQVLRELIDRLGASQLQTLIKVLSK